MSKIQICLLFLFLLAKVNSHSLLHWPTPRSQDSNLKEGPCGGIPRPVGTPTIEVQGGQKLSIWIKEAISHAGAPWRLDLSGEGTDNGNKSCVLLDNIPHKLGAQSPNYGDKSTYNDYFVTVNIPDINCNSCSIMMSNPMTDKIGANGGRGGPGCKNFADNNLNVGETACRSVYHSCSIPLKIVGKSGISRDNLVLQPNNACTNGATIKSSAGAAISWYDPDSSANQLGTPPQANTYRRISAIWDNGLLMNNNLGVDVESQRRELVGPVKEEYLKIFPSAGSPNNGATPGNGELPGGHVAGAVIGILLLCLIAAGLGTLIYYSIKDKNQEKDGKQYLKKIQEGKIPSYVEMGIRAAEFVLSITLMSIVGANQAIGVGEFVLPVMIFFFIYILLAVLVAIAWLLTIVMENPPDFFVRMNKFRRSGTGPLIFLIIQGIFAFFLFLAAAFGLFFPITGAAAAMSAMGFLLFLCEAAMILIALAVFMHKDEHEDAASDEESAKKAGRSDSVGTATTVVATTDGVEVSTDDYNTETATETPQNTDDYAADNVASSNGNTDDYTASTDDYSEPTNNNTDENTPDDDTGAKIHVAEYDYQAERDDELSFTEGQRIQILNERSDGWGKGVLIDAEDPKPEGMFPMNYTKPV